MAYVSKCYPCHFDPTEPTLEVVTGLTWVGFVRGASKSSKSYHSVSEPLRTLKGRGRQH